MTATEDVAARVVLREGEGDDPQAIYNAIRFLVQFVPDGPALAVALAQALADVLRTVPQGERGAVVKKILDEIASDVRASMQ
jgi:hypothetical protein